VAAAHLRRLKPCSCGQSPSGDILEYWGGVLLLDEPPGFSRSMLESYGGVEEETRVFPEEQQ